MSKLTKQEIKEKTKNLMELYETEPQDLTAAERQFLVDQGALTEEEVNTIPGDIYIIPKKYYQCFDKDVDFRKCVTYAQGVNVASEMSEEDKKAMIDDGLVIDDDTHWNQLDNLQTEGEITEHEREFIEENFDTLRSWANFRPYFQVEIKDSIKDYEDIENEMNGSGLVATDYFDNLEKASNLINDDFETVQKTWNNLSDKDKKEALKNFLDENDVKLSDVVDAKIIIKQSYLNDNDSWIEEDYEEFPIELTKQKER